ncbi:hydrogenase 2 operon protein HybA [Desulfogranum japonicum]|uniref:hydrogenase 2 operon protein HybA n=1 Tax=Desulfogranum japonicum TaxID=231447 RepID=UPI0004011FB3|nr:hydrogenase 2 operon protein HybA [Desulfogranum japonicum]
MAINRRDFLKFSAGTGLMLAAEANVGNRADAKELPRDAVGILYDATLCIGCMSCMVNCKKANSEPGGALYHRETAGKIPYEYEGEEKKYDAPTGLSADTLCVIKAYRENSDAQGGVFSFIKQHCLHCVNPACVSVCPVAALQKDPDSGIVTYNKNRCFGCRYCQVACPFGIPMYEWEKASPSVVKCQLCNHRYAQGSYSACCEACPTGASLFGKVKDLREEAARRLALKPGDTYAYPVNHIEHGKTTEQVVPEYVDHIYGLDEAGGTQYMFLAGVEFDKLGFNPRITNQIYPEYTWSYVSHVPQLIGALLVAGTACRIVTQKLDKEKDRDK